MATPKKSYTILLTASEADEMENHLRDGNYRLKEVPHTRVAVNAQDCNINLYKSGKCLIQGKGAAEFVEFVMEPVILKRILEDVPAAQVSAEESIPHMGIDESGKGDFFGPLVIASAFVTPELAKSLRKMGVQDSKLIKNDKRALAIGAAIEAKLGKNRFALVTFGSETYNRVYSKMRSVNRILAWGHARSIENLLERTPGCGLAISDQFGDASQVEKALMKKGQKIKLIQRHKAESDVAVAAASILARAYFLKGLQKLEREFGQPFPKGASPAVQEAARKLVNKHGPQILMKVAKTHFRTTDKVLQDCGSSRKALPAEGQAVSQAKRDSYKKPAKSTKS